MKNQNRVSQLTLELYHRGLAAFKERKQVEKALKTDIDVQNRYKALEESERETSRLYTEELRRLNIHVTPKVPAVITGKTAGIILAIAAGLLCAIIPAFFYLKGKASNKETAIAESSAGVSETETTEDFLFGDNEEIEGLENIFYDENKFNFEKKTETAENPRAVHGSVTEPEPRIEPESGVSIATVPETDTGVRLRGADQTKDQGGSSAVTGEPSNINIPPGLTSIFENMFADKLLVGIVIPDRITSIAKNAFAGNPALVVTIGANVNVHDEAIPGNFAKAYNSYGRAAGTYTRPNSNSEEWEKK
jgi:hypothetical protein